MLIGVDVVQIDRWERILEKFPKRVDKIFTEEEKAHCEKKGKKRAESYAALWGAREAAGKALGIGIFGSAWQDAFVTWGKWGAPEIHLQGTFKKRADELGVKRCSISISHEAGIAVTVVAMEGENHDSHNK
jgi:holo-[acyl-carrier protein] synthase